MATPASNPRVNHAWRIRERPHGMVEESNFQWNEETAAAPDEGQVLVRNIYLSLDPTNRVWMEARDSYLPMLPLNAVMRGITLGVVEESRNPRFAPGDIVQGLGGWQEYSTGDGAGWTKLPRIPDLPLTAYFGAMGHIGFTAYFGLMDIAKPDPGETLVVSAAAGAVGSLAGQMGKIAGCRVVGIAGSDEKCEWITRELGFDAAINYKKENLRESLKRHCPDGIDIDFENVGGEVMEAVFDNLRLGARIALCGLISAYNAGGSAPGPSNFGNLLIQRARLQGFIVLDYAARFPEATAQIVQWLQQGKLKYRIDLVNGLRNAPTALARLFQGANVGKLLVKVSEEPAG